MVTDMKLILLENYEWKQPILDVQNWLSKPEILDKRPGNVLE